MSASDADRDDASRRRAAGRAPSAAGSAARTGRTPAGAGRRPPPAGGGGRRWTAPAAPAGSGRWAARSAPAPAGTPPAAGRGSGSAGRRPRRRWSPVRAASERVSCPATSCASSVSRSRSDSRARAAATAACSSRASRPSSGGCRRRQVDDAVLVALVPVLLPPHGGDHVARRDDRVGLEHPRLHPAGRGEHPHQGLLDEVVDRGGVGDPRGDDPPHHRDERGHVGLRRRGAVRLGGPLSHHARDATPGRVPMRSRSARPAVGCAVPLEPPLEPECRS